MQDLTALEGKTLAELREIGKVLGITDSTLKKKELLNAITRIANGEQAEAPAAAADEAPRKRGRRPRMATTRIEENTAEPSADVTAEPAPEVVAETPAPEPAPAEAVAEPAPQPKRRGRKPKAVKEMEERAAREATTSEDAPEQSAEEQPAAEPAAAEKPRQTHTAQHKEHTHHRHEAPARETFAGEVTGEGVQSAEITLSAK